MATKDWNDPSWLFAPDASVVDDVWDVVDTIGADYQEERAIRLITTVELRLAKSINHFDNAFGDDRVIRSIVSELNFVRAVWGEIRHARSILPPRSRLLSTLQDCADRKSWDNVSSLRHEASVVAISAPAHPLLANEQFPIIEWWATLPTEVAHISPFWRPFDMGDAILALGLSQVNASDVTELTEDLATLAKDLMGLQDDLVSSNARLEVLEEQVANKLHQDLHCA